MRSLTVFKPSGATRAFARRRGFSLVALLVVIVAVAVLAAAAIPLVSSAEDEQAAARVAAMLASLDSSMTKNSFNAAGDMGFCKYLGRCPGFLTDLAVQIIEAAPSCGSDYKKNEAKKWSDFAPWSGLRIVPGSGVQTPFGTVHDTVVRLTGNTAELHLDSLTADQVNYLDIAVDGVAGAAVGNLRYAASPGVFAATGQTLYLARYQLNSNNVNC